MSKEDVNLAVRRLTGREDVEEVAQMVQDGQPTLDQMRRVLHFAILQSNEGRQQLQQAQEHMEEPVEVGDGVEPPKKIAVLEKKIDQFRQQQSEDAVSSAKAQVRAIAVAG